MERGIFNKSEGLFCVRLCFSFGSGSMHAETECQVSNQGHPQPRPHTSQLPMERRTRLEAHGGVVKLLGLFSIKESPRDQSPSIALL